MFFVYFLGFALFVTLFTREVIAPASGASCDKRWRIFAGAINALNIVVVLAAGVIFSTWIGKYSLLTLPEQSNSLLNSILIFLTASFIAYWWHRFTHKSDIAWRIFHQLHHSPTRIESLTAFYTHPFDSLAASLLNAFVAYIIFGATALEAGLVLLYVTIFSLVAHTDSKTPYILGYFLQRPEMHRVHHEHNVHQNNYGLPVIDMIFGTWKNPKDGKIKCGFDSDKEYRIRDMLMMRDVHKS